jgi:small subunit ribosomal protein S4e
MHQTRNEVMKAWPIPRKGTRFVVVPEHNKKNGIPLMIILRDMLKLAKTRTEVKRILESEKIKVNGKMTKEEKFPLSLFDILSVESKNYKITLKNRKFELEETKEHVKISKIINKKILGKGKAQINLNDGRNFISKEKISVGDSVVFDINEKKISKIIQLKQGSSVVAISGSHIGETGKIEDINEKKKEAEIRLGEKKVNLELKRLMAI